MDVWNYVVTELIYTQITPKLQFLSSRNECGVKKDDIILLYLKGKGYFGITYADGDEKRNDGKKKVFIFKDSTLNVNYFPIHGTILFDKDFYVTPKQIIGYIQENITGFKSVASFRRKHLNGLVTFTVMDQDKGYTLVNKLIELNNNLSKMKKKEKEKKQKEIEKEKKEKEPKYEEPDVSSGSDSEPESESSDSDSDSVSSSDSEDETTTDHNDIYGDIECFIPVMLVPCKIFNINHINNKKYVIKHIKECGDCVMTNNNNLSLMDKLQMNNTKLITDINYEGTERIIEYYQLCMGYKPRLIKDSRYSINIIPVDETIDIYGDCILFTWCRDK